MAEALKLDTYTGLGESLDFGRWQYDSDCDIAGFETEVDGPGGLSPNDCGQPLDES